MTNQNQQFFSLLVHDLNYSKSDLILNQDLLKGSQLKIGDLIQIGTIGGGSGGGHSSAVNAELGSINPQASSIVGAAGSSLGFPSLAPGVSLAAGAGRGVGDSKKILFKVSCFADPNSSIQISIAQNIAALYDISPRSLVKVKKITDIESVACSTIEICFREQYIGRSDMWQLKMSLVNTAVYVGKKVSNLGVRGQVKAIYVGGVPKTCGYVQEDTRTIFRSETAKFFIFIQMSKEMWEFDEDGEMFLEKCVFGFLPELFAKWKESGANHVVSIVLFARVVYPHAVVLNSIHSSPENDIHFHRDVQNRPCRDFYKVIIDWESKIDWTSILVHLKKQAILFQKEILQQTDAAGSTILAGSNSTAQQGNLLEAINLALNPFDKHYIDRDLSRTGLSIVVISPSTGIFEVDKKLCRMTVQRMIDSGISLDLVCLSPPPLHSVPLFQFQSRQIPGHQQQQQQHHHPYSAYSDTSSQHHYGATAAAASGLASTSAGLSGGNAPMFATMNAATMSSKGGGGTASSIAGAMDAFDHLYMDDQFLQYGTSVEVFMIPDWIDVSFWKRQLGERGLDFLVGKGTMAGSNVALAANEEVYSKSKTSASSSFMTRCKMYEVQMGIVETGILDMDMPCLDLFDPDDAASSSASPPSLQLNRSGGGDMMQSHSVTFSAPVQDPTATCDDYDQSIFKSTSCYGGGDRGSLNTFSIFFQNTGATITSATSHSDKYALARSASSGRSWGKVLYAREGSKSPDGKSFNHQSNTMASSLGESRLSVKHSSSMPFGSFSERFDRQKAIRTSSTSKSGAGGGGSAFKEVDDDVIGGGEIETSHEYSSSIEPIRIRNKSGGGGGGRDYDYNHVPRSSFSNESPNRDSRGSPISQQRGGGGGGATIVKFSPSKTPTKNLQLLRHKYINPFQTGVRSSLLGASDRRWEHIFPKWISHDGAKLHTNWKSLCTPACLPLTIEYFPSPEELSEFYLEYTYTVSPAFDDAIYNRDQDRENRKIESLLIELISQRLAQGFQLIVSPHVSLDLKQASGAGDNAGLSVSKTVAGTAAAGMSSSSTISAVANNNSTPTSSSGGGMLPSSSTSLVAPLLAERTFSISRPYFLSLGDHVHRLFYDSSGNNVEVKRYTRRLNYNTDTISYTCNVWARHMNGYQSKSVTFSYPALSSYNWNYLDHLISGYQDQMTDALRFWRIRFLLIPLETPPSISSSTAVDTDRLDEEEERIVGFSRFMEMIEKSRFVPAEERKRITKVKKSLDIQLTTLNLSSLVASEDVHSLLPEAFAGGADSSLAAATSASPNSTNNTSNALSKRSSIEAIGKAMLQDLVFQDRHWHFKVYESVITGEELINWIIQQFSDVESREAAIEIGNLLIDGGVLEHVKRTHKLLDGFYFYRFCQSWASPNSSSPTSKSPYSLSPGGGQSSSSSVLKKRFQSVKQVTLDLDPLKKSSRQELAMLHYDTTHNTKNCYHFQLHWLVCTARLIEDMLHSWARMADKCGFKLVEAPGGQADDNPFQAMVPVQLASKPPPIEKVLADLSENHKGVQVKIPKEFFERELLSFFNFCLDTESDSLFPPASRGFSYQRKDWAHTQYVYRSGVAFIQILPSHGGFLWYNNRLHLASSVGAVVAAAAVATSGAPPGAAKSTPLSTTSPSTLPSTQLSPDSLRDKFTAFCNDKDALESFWASLLVKLGERVARDLSSGGGGNDATPQINVNGINGSGVLIVDSL